MRYVEYVDTKSGIHPEMLKTTEYCVCVQKKKKKMECRIRDELEAKINMYMYYYAKTLLTSTFNSIHVRQPLNFTDWDPFVWPALR